MRFRSFTRFLLWLALGLGVALIVSAPIVWFRIQLNQPFKGYVEQEIRINVARGSTVSAIGDLLEGKGVISSSRLFRLYVHLKDLSTDLKAGEYHFNKSVSLKDVVDVIESGRVYYHRVTVPEGLEIPLIAEIFVQAQFGDIPTFQTVMNNPQMISDLDPEAEGLEGYLFPETYFLTSGTNEREIVAMMLANFRQFWTPEKDRRAKKLGMTVREIITLASLIEKETGMDSERPLVSAVFHNRLQKNMKLACDPTVIYAVKRVKPYDGVINRSDLELDSPYNTYVYPGLPPGPIANPGRRTIEAALYPADSEYLYFVSRNDGSHIFSSDYRDHARAVNRYQR